MVRPLLVTAETRPQLHPDLLSALSQASPCRIADCPRLGTRHGIVNRGRPGPRLLPFSRLNLSPASVVGHYYLHLLGRGVAAAIGAGDGNCVDASVPVALPLCSKQHMMIVQHNPVWRCMAASVAKDWFIAAHIERARARWQRTVVSNVIADRHIHHSVVWWPQSRWIG